jgi:glycosyltransferase involved in cell wall biosynthesis
LPFGASIDFIPKQKLLKKIILKKNRNICKLISIGVHWDRKGMDKAVKLVDYMNNSGQETILYIVGAKPPKDYKISSNVKLIDFLDKNNLNDRKILIKLMYNAHFNLLFSKSEAFGVVNVEASAFGLYSITNNIGGIGGAVTNDINGFMFKDNENISTISKYIIRIFRNKDLFIKKSFLSRKQYQEKGGEIKEKNKAYYYKYKFNVPAEELKKYDTLLPIVVRIRKELDELKEKKPEFIKEILEPYYHQNI